MPNPLSASKASSKSSPKTSTTPETDWNAVARTLDARPRDKTYNDLCDRFNAGERTEELRKAIEA